MNRHCNEDYSCGRSRVSIVDEILRERRLEQLKEQSKFILTNKIRCRGVLFYSVEKQGRFAFCFNRNFTSDNELFTAIAEDHHMHGGWSDDKEDVCFELYKNEADTEPMGSFLAFCKIVPQFSIHRTE